MTAHAIPFPKAAPLTGGALWFAAFLLALGNFMVVLDITIANVSVPNIAGGLAVSPSQGTWVITSYSVAEAIVVPLTGWLSARFGTVKVFLFGIIGFGEDRAFDGCQLVMRRNHAALPFDVAGAERLGHRMMFEQDSKLRQFA